MSETRDPGPSPDNATELELQKTAELEREILAGREFSLTEAIARMAGGGLTKGASPISRQRQAQAEIEEYLRHNLKDSVLGIVLLRKVGQCDLLLNNYDRPLAVLSQYTNRVLESESLLRILVEETDVEWGRVFRERPYFDKVGGPAHPDDPYTMASVRDTLSQLASTLTSQGTAASG